MGALWKVDLTQPAGSIGLYYLPINTINFTELGPWYEANETVG